MATEKINTNESNEILSRIDAVVDEMNASRMKRLFERYVDFPIHSMVSGAKAGAIGFGVWGGVWGAIGTGPLAPGGALVGTAIGAGIGAVLGGAVGLLSAYGKKAPFQFDLPARSYKQWQREQAKNTLEKRDAQKTEQILAKETADENKAQHQAFLDAQAKGPTN